MAVRVAARHTRIISGGCIPPHPARGGEGSCYFSEESLLGVQGPPKVSPPSGRPRDEPHCAICTAGRVLVQSFDVAPGEADSRRGPACAPRQASTGPGPPADLLGAGQPDAGHLRHAWRIENEPLDNVDTVRSSHPAHSPATLRSEIEALRQIDWIHPVVVTTYNSAHVALDRIQVSPVASFVDRIGVRSRGHPAEALALGDALGLDLARSS